MEIDIVDQCDHLDGLIVCLSWVVSNNDFLLYHAKPHDYLIRSIRDKVEEISQAVMEDKQMNEIEPQIKGDQDDRMHEI